VIARIWVIDFPCGFVTPEHSVSTAGLVLSRGHQSDSAFLFLERCSHPWRIGSRDDGLVTSTSEDGSDPIDESSMSRYACRVTAFLVTHAVTSPRDALMNVNRATRPRPDAQVELVALQWRLPDAGKLCCYHIVHVICVFQFSCRPPTAFFSLPIRRGLRWFSMAARFQQCGPAGLRSGLGKFLSDPRAGSDSKEPSCRAI